MACHFELVCATRDEAPALLAGRECVGCPHLAWAEVELVVTEHAVARFRERLPGRGLAGVIKSEVREAMAAGRISADEMPDWRPPRTAPRAPGHAYAWPESREVVFVLSRDADRQIVVVTVLAASSCSRERSAAA